MGIRIWEYAGKNGVQIQILKGFTAYPVVNQLFNDSTRSRGFPPVPRFSLLLCVKPAAFTETALYPWIPAHDFVVSGMTKKDSGLFPIPFIPFIPVKSRLGSRSRCSGFCVL